MKNIKYFVADVDGTLTDGKIYMGAEGEICKTFNIKDGIGIHDILLPSGIVPIIITGRESQIVLNRCRELGITQIYQGVKSKKEKLLEAVNGSLANVAYAGDDINDFDCMNKVKQAGGFVGCPADAVDAVRAVADYISPHNGGEGAVRDFIEWLVRG